jgi:hypothetical protein
MTGRSEQRSAPRPARAHRDERVWAPTARHCSRSVIAERRLGLPTEAGVGADPGSDLLLAALACEARLKLSANGSSKTRTLRFQCARTRETNLARPSRHLPRDPPPCGRFLSSSGWHGACDPLGDAAIATLVAVRRLLSHERTRRNVTGGGHWNADVESRGYRAQPALAWIHPPMRIPGDSSGRFWLSL